MNTETASRIDEFLAVAPPPPTGQDLVPAQQLGLQLSLDPLPMAGERDMRKVVREVRELAAVAGNDWYWEIPFKNRKTGQTDYKRGPSIKLTNDVARIYGNASVDCRVQDLGTAFLVYARFYDKQTGYELVRPYQGSKSVARIGGSDDDRRQDMALQAAVSRAQRNVVHNALQTLCDMAQEEAENSLRDKISRNLEGSRDRILARLEEAGIEPHRVEAVLGRAVGDWRVQDVLAVHARLKPVEEGFATASETFPPVRDNTAAEGDPSVNRLDAYLAEGAGVRKSPDRDSVKPVPDAAAGDQSQPPEPGRSPAADPDEERLMIMAEAVDKAIRLATDSGLTHDERHEALVILRPTLEKMIDPDFVANLMAMAENVIEGKTPAAKAVEYMRAMVR
jgi:hypothetical protein